ncbi:hypothetical protein Tco_0981914 [Tanacetum coccineum]
MEYGGVPEFMQKREEKKNKRYKPSDSNSFDTRESGEGSINLNSTVGDEKDKVLEVLLVCPIGRDQAKRKAKAGSSSADQKTGAATQGCGAGNTTFGKPSKRQSAI